MIRNARVQRLIAHCETLRGRSKLLWRDPIKNGLLLARLERLRILIARLQRQECPHRGGD